MKETIRRKLSQISKEDVVEAAKEGVAGFAGGGSAIGAISAAGVPGLSAAGITSGLATIGCGAMLPGIFVAGGIAYVGYKGSKSLIKSFCE